MLGGFHCLVLSGNYFTGGTHSPHQVICRSLLWVCNFSKEESSNLLWGWGHDINMAVNILGAEPWNACWWCSVGGGSSLFLTRKPPLSLIPLLLSVHSLAPSLSCGRHPRSRRFLVYLSREQSSYLLLVWRKGPGAHLLFRKTCS